MINCDKKIYLILRVDHNGTKLVQNFNLTFLGIIVLLCVEWIMNIPYFSCLFYSHKNNLHFDSLSVYLKNHLLKIKFRKKKPEHSHSMHETVKNEISYWIKIRLIELLCNVCIGVSQSKHQKGRRAYSELSNKPAHHCGKNYNKSIKISTVGGVMHPNLKEKCKILLWM